ncbi:hypothetical protein HCN51_15805 [Nonomuraea sp. FMUSA5-5]|uniref:Phthalyl amidase n=1 Tax=Nonomuraea composti TaxID=2720023 RepID=A0ABX1B2X9_9ACTN|nr:hypothetical protein [Nonomuraea sp. FMUSA5-5]NJP90905.1 hypothetical protein [Nonomuraea sp. FMUSA5-5]
MLRHLPRLRRTTAVMATACALALSATTPATADDTDPDQPLPGYTVDNPPLPPLTVGGRPTRVLQGMHQHAAYTIEIPPNWNGQLAMWAHGLRGGTVLTVETPPSGLREAWINQGYAWAASSYTKNGYDAGDGVTSTRALARHAARLLPHRPGRTYLSGGSMGGHVLGRSLEEYPGSYAAGLSLCGQLSDNRLFDFFLDVNLAAQALSGVDAYPAPANYASTALPQIQSKLGLTTQDPANEAGRQFRQVITHLSGGTRPGADAAASLYANFLLALAPTGPSVAQNVTTRYTPTTPIDINPIVERVAPASVEERTSLALNAVPRILGKPGVPVLSLNDIGDLVVPLSTGQIYARAVARHGQSDLLVQRAIRATGHCDFTPAEVTTAWNDLRRWVEAPGHRRPAGDDLLNARIVASPTFGCRFTDPAVTRAFYEACPAG